jgi:hypothetical protein
MGAAADSFERLVLTCHTANRHSSKSSHKRPLRPEALGTTLRKFTTNHKPAGDGCDLIWVRDEHQMRTLTTIE